MARKRRNGRVYWRNERAYGDFRDLGGGRERLVATGEKVATTDSDIAHKLVVDRVEELEEQNRMRVLLKVEKKSGLKEYAAYHLEQKAKEPKRKGKRPVVKAWLVQTQKHLTSAVAFLGSDTELASITTEDLDQWVDHLREQDNGRDGTLSETSVRKYLNSLSNLLRRAKSQGYVASNPVADMFSKPAEDSAEAPHLSAQEAALLLESARTYEAPVGDGAFPWMYPLLATALLTGGRKNEILGLEVDDLSLRHDKVYIRPNDWRRLKTRGSKRTVPLWPQLKEILSEYILERERTGGLDSLLFPSGRSGGEKMVRDVRKALDHIGERAGFPRGFIRLHMLRHTYAAARIQTCDRGRPVALYTVARELGHKGTEMLEDRYAHLHDATEAGDPEVVEYRVEHHQSTIKEKLEAIR